MTRPAAQPDRAREEYAALVRDAADGDAAAMERLLIRAQEVAYRFSLLICGHVEDAEDVMQDALLGTYRHVREIADPSAFRTWLYSTVRNACLMKRRRRAGEPASFVPVEQAADGDGQSTPVDVPSAVPRPDERMVDAWIDRRLRRALASLPPAYRMIVVLREIEGLTTREVAAVSGLSEANVKTRLRRAHAMLRKQLHDV
jgi:RNA polymerase sigma-70 factor (ECF subfamily)